MFAIWSEKYVTKNALGPRVVVAVRSLEVRGGRFSEVADVLQVWVWELQSVPRALFTLGSVSASRTVRSGRFYCNRQKQATKAFFFNSLSHFPLQLVSFCPPVLS